ncbi:YisL family protein [Brevibacillus aydinogluensis]|uniref:YisL family protein n=1 Tax=Brevibacillus aydinogluensis TaxID=927786 RepID=UPI0035DCF2BA
MMSNAFLEAHVGGWEVAFILLIVGYILFRLGKEKVGNIVHMFLRVMMVIVVVTGGWMLFKFHTGDVLYYVKGLLGIVVFGLMEMALGRARRQEASIGFFVGALALMVLVILIGYRVIV